MSRSIPLADALDQASVDPEFRAECERNAFADAVSVWLVAYRATHQLTQRQLAEKVGMKQAAIARMELGDVEPKLSTLHRLAQALGVDLIVELGGGQGGVSVATV